ncbi:MAG: 3-phosphoshikimate 1-carboxyvinyltransferase, partial [Sutterella wadsworthensis]
MIATIQKGFLSGKIPAISSKSYAHRLLIAAALADRPTTVRCATVSEDILTASRVLKAMGASVERTNDGFIVEPVSTQPAYCGESGTIERFILPVACALGLDASITGHGRLPERPLSPLYEELRDHGIELSPQGVFPLKTKGRLPAGDYAIAADVSSQFIGGLLFALSVVPGTSTLTLTGRIESAPYIDMTLDVLALFGARITRSEDGRRFTVEGLERLRSPGAAEVEGDWSNSAFWLCAGALGRGVTLTGLRADSRQGDRAVVKLLEAFGAEVSMTEDAVTVRPGALRGMTVNAPQIPDLVPVLSVVAAFAEGETRFINAGRLRIKESDRLATTRQLLEDLGADVEKIPDGLVVRGRTALRGGACDGTRDHR